MGDRGVDRREFIATGAFAAAGAAGLSAATQSGAAAPPPSLRPKPPLGKGGTPMSLDTLADLARKHGRGEPILFVDLAALDQNLALVTKFAAGQGWNVRPALKSFRSPKLAGYVLRRLPRPLGMVFNLAEVDATIAEAPAGTDLMGGWTPTFGELHEYLATKPPPGQPRHRMRILIDSVPLMELLGREARRTRRRLPIDVALELDVGMGRGGIGDRSEMKACTDILRANRERLRLGAVVGYDGHATLDPTPTYRQTVAAQAQFTYRAHLANLADVGGDLYNARELIRNGPGSSNYRNWSGGPITEISPGSALLYAGYLAHGFDPEGLAPGLTAGGPVRRITSDHPSVPVTGTTLPGSTEQEIIVGAIAPPAELVHPEGAREDELSGGADALVVPKGSVALGDYVLYRPVQLETLIANFDALWAARDGRVRRLWAIPRRPGRVRRPD